MFTKNEEIIITVIVGVLLILFLATVFIVSIVRYKRRMAKELYERSLLRKQYEQELLQSRLETQEYTFQQIGKELHDNLGQLLSTVRMLLGITERNLANPPETLCTANETLGKAIVELRSLSKSLDKEWLEQFNFYDNLAAEITRINSTGSIIRPEFSYTEDLLLKPEEQIVLFRIVQEAIQNAIRHAAMDVIIIRMAQQGELLSIMVIDNGKGFTAESMSMGMGLKNMNHRAAILGGTLTWNSIPGEGTTVHITLPVKKGVT